jgi:hypothetical protein
LIVAKHRIGTELKQIPKATLSGKGQARTGNRKDAKSGHAQGRSATGVHKDARSRLGKLASVPVEKLKGNRADQGVGTELAKRARRLRVAIGGA